MKFTKMQGTGNDFILVEAHGIQRNWAKMAISMCNRHFGIGADGLLLILPSEVADFKMRIFNRDGSEDEACGNGLRCLAKYVLDKGLTSMRIQEISVEMKSGIKKVKAYCDEHKTTKIKVSMDEPRFEAKTIPVIIEQSSGNSSDIKPILDYHITVNGEELALNIISMGTPHAVYLCQYPISNFPLSKLGPEIEKHKMFPQRLSLNVARILSRKSIEARVWERGVGETLACGSGACASVVIAQLHGEVDSRVEVIMPGGALEVEWSGAGEVYLSGPAETIFTGDWSE